MRQTELKKMFNPESVADYHHYQQQQKELENGDMKRVEMKLES